MDLELCPIGFVGGRVSAVVTVVGSWGGGDWQRIKSVRIGARRDRGEVVGR